MSRSPAIDPRILEYHSKGIIPGPEETEEEYLKRADYCLSLKERLQMELGKEIPFTGDEFAPSSCLEGALKKTAELYGIAPSWVPVFFADHQLAPWQGGCAWIFQVTESSPKAALIQLRKAFRNSNRYLRLYDREELLAHELAHAGRLSFSEPKFEEFFAYMSSSSPFRRFLGPIIKSSFESLLFVMLLVLVLVLDISAIALQNESVYQIVWYSKLVPAAFIAAAAIRLLRRFHQLRKTRLKLEALACRPDDASAILYRLTDREIAAFGGMETKDILDYIAEQDSCSLRWKVIKAAYLKDAG